MSNNYSNVWWDIQDYEHNICNPPSVEFSMLVIFLPLSAWKVLAIHLQPEKNNFVFRDWTVVVRKNDTKGVGE